MFNLGPTTRPSQPFTLYQTIDHPELPESHDLDYYLASTTTQSSSQGQSKSNSNRKLSKKSDLLKFSQGQTQPRSDQISKPRSHKLPSDTSSDANFSDPDDFFENFDKLFKVRESSEDHSGETSEALKPKNIRRSLLEDYDFSPARALSCEPDVLFSQERLSVRPISTKDKFLPYLDNVSYRPGNQVNSEYQMPDTISHNRGNPELKELARNIMVDVAKINATHAKIEKLPDIKSTKISSSKPQSFCNGKAPANNPAPTEGMTGLFDKINKFHEKFILKNRPKGAKLTNKVSLNGDTVLVPTKNSQQTLQNILKNKKVEPMSNNRCATLASEEGKDVVVLPARPSVNEELRCRVNSVQNVIMEEPLKKKTFQQKTDLSLDLGKGSKKKFMLKNVDQRTLNYYQGAPNGILNKALPSHGVVKETNETCTSSRSHYHKENMSMLSNSSRDKAGVEEVRMPLKEKVGNIKDYESHIPLSNFPKTSGSRMKIGDIAQMYKGIRQTIRQEQIKPNNKKVKLPANGFHSVKERLSVENRYNSGNSISS